MRSHNSLHHLFSKSLSYTKDSDRRLSLSLPPNGTELAYHFHNLTEVVKGSLFSTVLRMLLNATLFSFQSQLFQNKEHLPINTRHRTHQR